MLMHKENLIIQRQYAIVPTPYSYLLSYLQVYLSTILSYVYHVSKYQVFVVTSKHCRCDDINK